MSATISEDAVRAALAGEGTIDLGATIVPGRRDGNPSCGHGSIPTLTGLQLGETLGEGGMGIVRVGRQEALGRDVAVKMVRPGAPDNAEWALLAEARITGSLEHPNVIPVHTVGLGAQDGDGLSLVMKRVDGMNLADLLDDEDHPGWDLATGTRRAWLIEVLCQVCRALQFAHSRGIVHRDVKPDNIMVGAFGEVYLLDWGIAVPIGADAAAGANRDGLGVVGTPNYMAPEQTGHDFGAVTARTDVYLLGATLHECLTGAPRHVGPSLIHLLHSARQSEPVQYGPTVPQELAAICNRAMARDSAVRFESAEQLRRALADYLSHRTLREFCACSVQQLEQLESDLERGDVPSVDIHRTFGACRLGFREVLRGLPGDTEAQQGLERAVRLMIDYELSLENPQAAQLLLAELPGEHPELEERVAAQFRKLEAQGEELRRLRDVEAAHDLSVGGIPRAVFFLGMGVLLSVILAGMGVFELVTGLLPTVPELLLGGSVILCAGALLVFALRDKLMANRASGSIILTVLAGIAGVVANRALHLIQGEQDAMAVLDRDHLLFAFVLVTLGITVDRRVLAAMPIWTVGIVVVLTYPERTFFIVAATSLLGFGAIAALIARGTPGAVSRPDTQPEGRPGNTKS